MPCELMHPPHQAAGTLPDVSVVIPAYNVVDTILACLVALEKQTIERHRYEIIVVDDGSTDETPRLAAERGSIVLRQTNQGPAVARNRGIAASRGDVVLFTDADCAPVEDWIAQMLAPFDDSSVVGVKGAYRSRQRELAARFIQIEYEDRYDHTARSKHVDFIDTYAAAYRRQVLLAAGGFDARFPCASVEDQELSFRLAEAGHKFVFNPCAIVYHHHPESWLRYARRKFKIGYWKTLVLRLHPAKTWKDSHTPADVKLQMLLAPLSALLGLLAIGEPRALLLLGGCIGAFVLTAVPFLRKAWQRDRTIALLSLPALYVRAWALGLGLLVGNLGQVLRIGPMAQVARRAQDT